MAKFDIKTEATKPLYAGVGVTDLAVERVRDYVTVAQKRVTGIELEPKALRDQATTAVAARRIAVEKRVAVLQAEAKGLPSKVQALVEENLATANGAYDALISRGESLVTRIRRQQSTQATTSSAKTATTKAKTTRTQASKATRSIATTAKKSAGTTKKAAAKKSAPAKSSAKATGTAVKQTASNAAQATGDATAKVGD